MKALCRWLAAACFLLPLTLSEASLALDSDGGWKTVSGSGLIVRYHGDSHLLAGQILEKAGSFLAGTSEFLGLPWSSEYIIVIARNKEEFIELQPTSQPAPEWAGALTYPGLRTVLIMTPGAMATGGGRYWSLIQHEMVHLILGDAEIRFATKLPRWFQEGVATFVSGEMNLSRLLRLGWAQATGATPDFGSLEYSFPGRSAQAEAAYARSYLFIQYLTRRFGEDSIARLLEESFKYGGLRGGTRAAFGMSLDDLLKGFDQYARVKATWIPVATSTATIWGLITLLFLVTLFRKKIQNMRTIRQWEREERLEELAASLQEQKVKQNDKLSIRKKPTLH